MIITIAASALAIQLSMMPEPVAQPLVQPAQYGRVPVHPPPCGHGWDLSARDGLCYPNGYLPPQDQSARQYQYQRSYRGGRYPVPCGNGADVDIGTGYATRTERYRCSSSKDVSAITAATDITNVVRNADTTIRTKSVLSPAGG